MEKLISLKIKEKEINLLQTTDYNRELGKICYRDIFRLGLLIYNMQIENIELKRVNKNYYDITLKNIDTLFNKIYYDLKRYEESKEVQPWQ